MTTRREFIAGAFALAATQALPAAPQKTYSFADITPISPADMKLIFPVDPPIIEAFDPRELEGAARIPFRSYVSVDYGCSPGKAFAVVIMEREGRYEVVSEFELDMSIPRY